MRKNVIFSILLITLSCFSCTVDTDTTNPGIPTLINGKLSSRTSVILEWTKVTDDDLAIYELSESKVKGHVNVVARVNESYTNFEFKDRDFLDNKYYYQIRAVDLFGNRSAYSNALTIGISSNDKVSLKVAWENLENSLFYEAVLQFTKLVLLNGAEKSDAYVGRAWAYLKRAKGDKNSIYLSLAYIDFMKSNTNDSYAGRSILGLLRNDFNLSTNSSDFIKDRKLKNYTHKFLNHINYRYVLIHGAFAYWMKQNDMKVNDYLDEIFPKSSPHKLNRNEQKIKLSNLIGTISAPISEKEAKLILLSNCDKLSGSNLVARK